MLKLIRFLPSGLAFGGKLGHIAKNTNEDIKGQDPLIMTRNTLAVLLFAGLITGLVTGCSSDDDYLFDQGPAGPNTEKTLKNLPKGLLPDEARASHTDKTLKPDQ